MAMYEQFKGTRCLITGGLGFIGSSIAQVLVCSGARVTIIDACLEPYGWNWTNISEIADDVEVIVGDIRDKDLIHKVVKGANYIFNLAGQVSRMISIENPLLDINTNCVGTINILEACRIENPDVKKILFASSRGVTGEPVYLPVDENHPDNPTDIYGINKLAGEKYHSLYFRVHGTPAVSLRLNNVYGPRCQMKYGHYGVLNLFIRRAMKGEDITVYGDGQQTRDYIFIDDVVRAFLMAALDESTSGEVFCIGSGVETVFIDMVRAIVKTVGNGRVIHSDFPGLLEKVDIKRFVSSFSKAHVCFNWRPEIGLDEGIRKTVEFYRKRLAEYL